MTVGNALPRTAAILAAVSLAVGCGGSSAPATPIEGDLIFEGTGQQVLAPITVPRAGATLRWRTSGDDGLFILAVVSTTNPAADVGQLVSSQEAEGSTYVPAGRHVFKVAVFSGTSWAIALAFQ